MKIAITADVHLKSGAPERLANFAAVLSLLGKKGISTLIVAGDLLDESHKGEAQLDGLLKKHPKVELLVIPGNHDPRINGAMFAAPNISVFTEPQLKQLGGMPFLFLPYREGKTMGEALESSGLAGELKGKWALVSHGDYGRVRRLESGDEGGYYPLTRADLDRFRPSRVLLGHIHAPNELGSEVVFPGSPYPLDINETGQRRLLLLDTKSGGLSEERLLSPPLYAQAEIFVYPCADEAALVEGQLSALLAALEKEYSGGVLAGKLTLRLAACGFSRAREEVARFMGEFLEGKGITLEGEDTIRDLKTCEDTGIAELARKVSERVGKMKIGHGGGDALRREVLKRSYEIIYGR